MEFILRDYFQFRFPDLLIITMPFAHDTVYRIAGGDEMVHVRADIEIVFNVVVKYTPPTTQVGYTSYIRMPSAYGLEFPRIGQHVRKQAALKLAVWSSKRKAKFDWMRESK